jgi:hypothetical protein
MRVVKNNGGSEAMVIVFQTTEMTNEVYEEYLQTVKKDLNHLKTVIEEIWNNLKLDYHLA